MFDQPRLADELARLGIWDLGIGIKGHEVGPVEFKAVRCTAPLTYALILAGIANKAAAGGDDISIQDIWWRIESIDDPQPDEIPLIVP